MQIIALLCTAPSAVTTRALDTPAASSENGALRLALSEPQRVVALALAFVCV